MLAADIAAVYIHLYQELLWVRTLSVTLAQTDEKTLSSLTDSNSDAKIIFHSVIISFTEVYLHNFKEASTIYHGLSYARHVIGKTRVPFSCE